VDPFTLMMAATGVQALGSIFQGIMGQRSGIEQMRAEQHNAQQAMAESGVQADLALRQGDQAAATGAVRAAANSGGGGISSTAVGVINEASSNAYFNARGAAYKGITTADADYYQGNIDRANGNNALISGVIGAAGDIIGGSAQAGFRQSILNSRSAQMGDVSPYEMMGF
jgi:hypothetical protein